METYTIVHEPQPVYHASPPFAFGIIKLDGGDTGIIYRLGEIDYKKIHVGMRVKAVFEE